MLDLFGGEFLAYFVERFDCLVAHERFFYRSKVVKGSQEDVSVLWPSNVLDKIPQLFAKGGQDLIFVLNRIVQEGYQLLSRSVGAQSEGDCRQPVYRIQS